MRGESGINGMKPGVNPGRWFRPKGMENLPWEIKGELV
jgi:hypothetical protein